MERYAPPPEVVTELENRLGDYSIQLRYLADGAGVVAVVKRADGACTTLLFDVADQPHRIAALWRGLDLHSLSFAPPRTRAQEPGEGARIARLAGEATRLAERTSIEA